MQKGEMKGQQVCLTEENPDGKRLMEIEGNGGIYSARRERWGKAGQKAPNKEKAKHRRPRPGDLPPRKKVIGGLLCRYKRKGKGGFVERTPKLRAPR